MNDYDELMESMDLVRAQRDAARDERDLLRVQFATITAERDRLRAALDTLYEVATDDAFANGPLEPSRPQLFAALLSAFDLLDAITAHDDAAKERG